jgi:uncharacterized protein
MGKIILFIVIFFVALLAVRLFNSRGRAGGAKPPRAPDGKAAPQLEAEPMLACSKCGALVPRSDALIVHGKPYCGAEHAKDAQS